MDKLEQVSENPELKEEMEREVTSTNSQVLTQAASWANWAVGAIGAKFYKSANKPPENATSSKSPSKETTPRLEDNKTETKPSHLQSFASKNSQELINLEDNANFGNSGDGWDNEDDEDWGSLEEPKKSVNNEIMKEEFDSWADDLMTNKVADKSTIVKQGVQALQLVSFITLGFCCCMI